MFALTVSLSEAGVFTWPEWTEMLIAASNTTKISCGESSFHGWLDALERVLAAKALTDREDLRVSREAWEKAARRTPHGRPIELES